MIIRAFHREMMVMLVSQYIISSHEQNDFMNTLKVAQVCMILMRYVFNS